MSVERPRGARPVRCGRRACEITVVPDEARPCLRAHILDQRLFDVGELIRQGLTDSKTGELPLI